MIHHNSPKNSVQKKFNMQLLCQTVGRNGFSLPRALWQVHCGRTDSYIGGKWIVITCLFLMTLGWVPPDLLQEFRIGLSPPLRLLPTLQISGGKTSLHRSRAQPLRGYPSVKQGVRFVKLSSTNASLIDVYFFLLLFVLIQTSHDGHAGLEGKERKIRNVDGCSAWNACRFTVETTARGINTIYVASICLIKERDGWSLWAKQLYSMDYTGIEALVVKSYRLRGDRGELQSVSRTRASPKSIREPGD